MAKYNDGILGKFQGTAGPIVGSTWKGINYLKARQRKSHKPRSRAQLEQQAKFTMLIRFLSSMGQLLVRGFKDHAIRMTGINSAYAYNYEHALTGNYPDYSLNYSKVLVSSGQLLPAANPTAVDNGNGKVRFSWTDNSGIAMANADDKCLVVVHCPELHQSVYTTSGAERHDCEYTINAGIFMGKTVETWVAFISADGANVATSIYTGQLAVS